MINFFITCNRSIVFRVSLQPELLVQNPMRIRPHLSSSPFKTKNHMFEGSGVGEGSRRSIEFESARMIAPSSTTSNEELVPGPYRTIPDPEKLRKRTEKSEKSP